MVIMIFSVNITHSLCKVIFPLAFVHLAASLVSVVVFGDLIVIIIRIKKKKPTRVNTLMHTVMHLSEFCKRKKGIQF